MLRNRGFVLFTVCNFISQISPEHIIYTDGWIPMTHNDIYKQIRREWTQYPVYITSKPSLATDKSFHRLTDGKRFDLNTRENNVTVIEKVISIYEGQRNINNKTTGNDKESSRRSKKILNPLDNNIDNISELPQNDLLAIKNTDKHAKSDVLSFAEASNTYEVTEENDISVATESNNFTEYFGYQYRPPKLSHDNTDENRNITATFYKILSKYNINANDKLQNYDQSLQRKVHNPSINGYRIPIPYRYNSLNHLPVDPLLAVFLSNYGFYLPNLYGIKSNYNNLYGYLASNNIHNNKPFGLYKIFSDSDSRN